MGESFEGYCFFDNGTYNRSTYLEDEKKAVEFIIKEKNNYPKVIVTDLNDNVVIEAINREIVFPNKLAQLDGLQFLKLLLSVES